MDVHITDSDYVVVGAGSAGCVLAERLSADGSRVVVLEAGGPDDNPMVKIPAIWSGMFQGPNDWNYTSEPEPGYHGRCVFLPRGKMLGGSSSLNAMFYVRGNRQDYDSWQRDFGATGWSYDDVLPYFIRSENNADIKDEFHGQDGPLHVTTQRWMSPYAQDFIEAAVSAGFARNPDFNGASQDGAGFLQVNAHGGERVSSADAFLRPAQASGTVDVITSAMVQRVLIVDGRAMGVEYVHEGVTKIVTAAHEVILSAGAYNSPQLLMLSGIGPAAHLREHGIDVVVDSPQVGQNLQDHPQVFLHYDTPGATTLAEAADPKHMEEWQTSRTGMLTTNAAETALFLRSDPTLSSPDFQVVFVPGYFWDHGFRRPGRPGMTIALTLNTPVSRGSVTLRSNDPSDQPRIRTNYLTHDSEVDAVLRAIEMVRGVAAQPPLADLLADHVDPGDDFTREQMIAWVRAEAQHMFHAACTCRIGPEGSGVVDPELRVHGVQGLRVVDASVMPRVTSGNTHAPTVMIAERAADLILASKLMYAEASA
ncbi:MAG: glucose-methanol-choline oxidoreductase [Frankiales bacterium]|nr:glucose-methanol-choline oxidoreductase [Frankiales bacterium]